MIQSETSNLYVNGITENAHIVSAIVSENLTLFKKYVNHTNVNVPINRQQYTLLHYMFYHTWNSSPIPFYEVLQENNCDINKVDEDDISPIMIFPMNEYTKPLVKRIVRDGGHLETNTSTFLQVQVFMNDLSGVKFAIEELHEDSNHTSAFDTRTPLELSLILCAYEITIYLLEKQPIGNVRLINILIEHLSINSCKLRKAFIVLQELMAHTSYQDLISLSMYHMVLKFLETNSSPSLIHFVHNCIELFMLYDLPCENNVNVELPS